MLHNNLCRSSGSIASFNSVMNGMLLAGGFMRTSKNKSLIHSVKKLAILSEIPSIKHLHIASNQNSRSYIKSISLYYSPRFHFSTTQKPNYNNFKTIRELSSLPTSHNKFNQNPMSFNFSPEKYQTIGLELDIKLQKIEDILHSPQKNLYKIVEEIIVVLEAFAKTKRRDLLEENVVKVVKEFGKKIVSAYFESLQMKQVQQLQRNNSTQKSSEQGSQFTDNTYSIRQNYITPPPQLSQKQFPSIQTSLNNSIDLNFILFYIQTIKSWLLMNVQTDSVIRQAEQQIFNLLNAREVSALSDTLKAAVKNLVVNYLEEDSIKKRDIFPFDMKLRGIWLLPFFENNTHVQKYMQRLMEENLAIYLRESQILTVMWDIGQLQPDLKDIAQFIYQIQSTQIYQMLNSLNGAYIKAKFIEYTRKFMVSYHEIQFYQIFRDLQSKMKYPTIRTFIRLCKIINTEAVDLHCDYNKVMNKYNYNIIISIIISQAYNVDNTRFAEFIELFQSINSIEKCGEILYDEMAKFLKAYWIKNILQLTDQEYQTIYKLFLHVISQAQPVIRYEDREGLNREFSRKTSILISILFNILLEKYPHIIFIGRKLIKNYLLVEDNMMSSLSVSPHDDRDLKLEIGGSPHIIAKIEKIKIAYTKLVQNVQHLPIYGKHQGIPFTLKTFLQSTKIFLNTKIQWTKNQRSSEQQAKPKPINKLPSDFKLLGNIYPTQQSCSFQSSFFKQIIQPIFKHYLDLANKDLIKKLSSRDFIQLYKNLQLAIAGLNSIQYTKDTAELLETYAEQLRTKVLYEMKFRLDQNDTQQQVERTKGIEHLNMAVPKGNIELLLCLIEIVELSNKLHNFTNLTKTKQHLSSNSSSVQFLSISELSVSLPLIYNFINKLAIKHLKAIEESDVFNIIFFIKTLEGIKTSSKNNLISLEINLLVWQYLYQSLSLFLIYISDKGRLYLKMTNQNILNFANVINHFVANKAIFRSLPSKKRLVVLQSIMVGLIRRKYFRINTSHLKRSEHAKILLSLLEIFQYPQNLTMDFMKILENVEFLLTDLEEFPTQILERFSDVNWTIARYLDSIDVNLTSSKKLSKLSIEELRKQFQEQKSSKIYEMILRNSNFNLPFILPEPKKEDATTKITYIMEKIYQKISKQNNYSVKKSSKGSKSSRNKIQVQEPIETPQQSMIEENIQLKQELLMQQKIEKSNQNSQNKVNLSQEKQYIMKESLVNYTYQDHYKIKQNKLPLHFKKENWKNLFGVSKDLEIQSLQIDEKIDVNIYKQVLLGLLGYVQKVKIVAKQFHGHSFIQYIAAQLDMEVFYHGCIARISRKNKPEQNVLFVCAVETNYKLLYICTHILRESGENAYIVMDKLMDNNVRDFLLKLLPQPFEVEDSQIVEKVAKGQIGLEPQEPSATKEDN